MDAFLLFELLVYALAGVLFGVSAARKTLEYVPHGLALFALVEVVARLSKL